MIPFPFPSKINTMVTRVNLLLTAVLLFRLTLGVTAQDLTCGTYAAGRLIQPNRIAAWHNPHGTQFIDGDRSRIQAPYLGPQTAPLMCLINPWLAGWVDSTFVSATDIAPTFNNQQLFAGPLNPAGLPYPDGCVMFNQVWAVDRAMIETHISDWLDNGQIDDTLTSIFGWPAQGNPFFETIHGFALPEDHRGGWAEFADQNGNGLYEPQLGEYPCISMAGVIRIPDEMHWIVFHDQDTTSGLERTPIGMEIQLTAYGFSCQDNDILNNTLFHRYKLVHQGPVAVDSLHFGIMFDPDLGCGEDDMIGSEPSRSMAFIYNRDSLDGNMIGVCTNNHTSHGHFPPMVSLTWLSDTMYAFGGVLSDDWFREEQYPLALLGLNVDGTPIRAGGNGRDQPDSLPVTRYLFPGDPRDSLQWNAYDAENYRPHNYGVPVIRPGRMESGETYIADMAFGFHQDSLANYLDEYPIMLAEVDQLRNRLPDLIDQCARIPLCTEPDECVWPGDINSDGVVDPIDLLHWGVMHGSSGPARNGRVNWGPQIAEPWTATTGDGVPFQHGDANGDGTIDSLDLILQLDYVGLRNPQKPGRDPHPPGDHLQIKGYHYNEEVLRFPGISLKYPVENVLGLAFAFNYDTTVFVDRPVHTYAPENGPTLLWEGQSYTNEKESDGVGISDFYAFVFKDQTGRDLNPNQLFIRPFRVYLKPGAELPDSTFVNIRNIYAVDAAGNDLHLGSSGIWIYKETVTSSTNPISLARSHLWPNPTTDRIHLETPILDATTLHDTQGRQVRSWTATDLASPLDIGDLPSGLYFLKLRGTGEVLKVIRQ